MPETIQTECLVIGAGVIGLAVAARLAERYDVILLEAHTKFGQETSSRNSEVIHSGIYYPPGSLKTDLCVRGREMLYAFCTGARVPYRQSGKFVIATEKKDREVLARIEKHAAALEISCSRVSGETIRLEEPLVAATEGLFFPESGIVDSHALMAALERKAMASGASFAYRHRVVRAEKNAGGWLVEWESPEGKGAAQANSVVNAAGLAAAELSNQFLGTDRFEHRYCRGRYFGLSAKYRDRFRHLVYPVPEAHGLGVHVTLDMAGLARLGPDVDWCKNSLYVDRAQNYECDWEKLRPAFLAAARRYLPSLDDTDLQPGLIGIRPKLFIDGEPHPDFLIENDRGYIHCLGMESPGLTAALAVAERVEELL